MSTLHDQGLLDGERFLGHAASARLSLEERGEPITVAALDSIIQPLFERLSAARPAGSEPPTNSD